MRALACIAVLVMMLLPALAYGGAVERAVKAEITGMLPWDAADIEVDDVEIPGLKAGKDARVSLDVPRRPTGPGKVSFKVDVDEKGAMKSYWGSARIKVFKDALVALRSMKNKASLSARDVRVARVELDEAEDSFATPGEITGMVAVRPIVAGAVIKRGYVKARTVVKRGEKVAINVDGPTIRIRSNGVASEDGHVGSVITVKTSSGREVAGVVDGPGEITVNF